MKPDDLRAGLAELAGLQQRTDAAERKILASAEQRLGSVNAMLRLAAPKAKAGNPDAVAEYQALVLERGQLNIVIARSRATLAQ